MLMEQIFVKWTCPRRVPSTVPGAPESSCFVCYTRCSWAPKGALSGWSRCTRPRRQSTLQGASLAVNMLRRSASAESRYTASPLTGEPTACADSPITMCESESHPHTPLSCVRFRDLLGYHTRTPSVDKRNIPCSFVPCCEASLQRAKPPEALMACGTE